MTPLYDTIKFLIFEIARMTELTFFYFQEHKIANTIYSETLTSNLREVYSDTNILKS